MVEVRYVDRVKRTHKGEIKSAVKISAITMERIVGGKYEWRDEGLAAKTGEMRRHWGPTRRRIWDPGVD